MIGLKRPNNRKAYRHQGRLRVLGKGQLGLGALPHQLREILSERCIDFRKDIARSGTGSGKRLAHADRLAALPGKNERNRHDDS